MELKPTRDKAGLQSRLDGLGNPVRSTDYKNPFAHLARGIEPHGAKRRRMASDTLGATPPRDGPFAAAAADVAVQRPPRARQRQQRIAGGLAAVFGVKRV